MSETIPDESAPLSESEIVAARRAKLKRFRDELGFEPYGQREDGLLSLTEARARFSEDAHVAFDTATKEAKAAGGAGAVADGRATVKIAGRVVQHSDMGKLVFLFLRDATGDLQVSVSKASVSAQAFELAKHADYGDILVAEGPIGRTNKGEVCVWATAISLGAKSLAAPPEKWHGLSDPELRYRRRYVDMYANPETAKVFAMRARII